VSRLEILLGEVGGLWIKGNSLYIYEKQQNLCCVKMIPNADLQILLWEFVGEGPIMEMCRVYGDVELNQEADEERAREGQESGRGIEG
jgi:hypothetical protein